MVRTNTTIEIISKRAQVSRTTVAHYLDGKFSRMSQGTRQKIKKAIAQLGPAIADGSGTRRARLVGVIVPDMTSPAAALIVRGVADACTQAGLQVITAASGGVLEMERAYTQIMAGSNVCGIIVSIADADHTKHLAQQRDGGVHIVLVDEPAADFDAVTADVRESVVQAVQQLYSDGFEAVGLMQPDLPKSTVQRLCLDAFVECSTAHIADPQQVVYTCEGAADHKNALTQFILRHRNMRTAILATEHTTLVQLAQAARDLNLRVPSEIAICGMDNLPWTELAMGGISVIERPLHEMGTRAAQILLAKIDGTHTADNAAVVLQTRFIARDSTRFAP